MNQAVTYRPGRPEDIPDQIALFMVAVYHLSYQLGIDREDTPPSAADLAEAQTAYGPLMAHLAQTGDQWWVAEQAGRMVGYARSMVRGDVRELTEFFVLPAAQAGGVGKALLARAFPADGVRRRVILATLDLSAQSLYLRTGVHHICPVYTFLRAPVPVASPGGFDFTPIDDDPETLAALDELDRAVLGYVRGGDHPWLAANRNGFLARRAGRPVGYGYVAKLSGPFIAADAAAMPALLAYGEQTAYIAGLTEFGLDVPMHNQVAVDYLLGRGYRLSPFFCHLLCDDPGLDVRRQIIMAPMMSL